VNAAPTAALLPLEAVLSFVVLLYLEPNHKHSKDLRFRLLAFMPFDFEMTVVLGTKLQAFKRF